VSTLSLSHDNNNSLSAIASRPGVEDEKCVVSQYRTTSQQRQNFIKHLEHNSRENIPLEWIIDIADETSGWFYATAYDYDDVNNMLHIMVPDKINPTFDGKVILDHRTVHLVECVDEHTHALFNRIMRDSVVKVKWDVEWFEDDPNSNEDFNGDIPGKWIQSSARYYIRIANQILVEDMDSEEGVRGFVMLSADQNIRLLHCHKGRGLDDFTRLIGEGVVQHKPEGQPDVPPSMDDLDLGDIYGQKSLEHIVGHKPANLTKRKSITGDVPLNLVESNLKYSPKESDHSQSFTSATDMSFVRKLVDMSHGLKECVSDLLDERDNQVLLLQELAKSFKSFALNGDLSEGLKLIEKSDRILIKKHNNSNGNNPNQNEDSIDYDTVADDAWKLSNKLEKSLIKYVKSQSDHVIKDYSNEMDQMKRMVNKMKQDIDDRDEELRVLRLSNRRKQS